MTQSLSEYIARCEAWGQAEGEQDFADILRAADIVARPKELATRLEIPEAVLLRWANGAAKPQQQVRRYVIEELRRFAVEARTAQSAPGLLGTLRTLAFRARKNPGPGA